MTLTTSKYKQNEKAIEDVEPRWGTSYNVSASIDRVGDVSLNSMQNCASFVCKF